MKLTKLKKWTGMALAAVMVLTAAVGFSGSTVEAAGTPEVKLVVQDDAIKAGEEFNVDVYLNNNPGGIAFEIKYTFDSAKLKLLGIEDSKLLAGYFPSQTFDSIDLLWTDYTLTTNNTKDGKIATLKFKAVDGIYGETKIEGGLVRITDAADLSEREFTATTSIIDVACAHSYGSWTQTTAPTCDNAGVETKECSICGDKQTQSVEKLTHKWNAGKVTTEATCTEDGVKTYACTNTGCNETKTETITKLGHKWNAGKVTTEATCTEDGVKTYECTACDETKTEVIKAAHKWDEGKIIKEATCTETGSKDVTCTVCGEKETQIIEALGHAWDEGKVTKEATATAEGEKTYTCVTCDETKTEVIAKLTATEKPDSTSPKTGDVNNMAFWMIALLGVVVVAGGAGYKVKSRAK